MFDDDLSLDPFVGLHRSRRVCHLSLLPLPKQSKSLGQSRYLPLEALHPRGYGEVPT